MRVLQVIQSYEVGGLEKMVLHLSEGLVARGVEVDVVAYLDDGPMRLAFERAGVRTHLIAGGGGIRPGQALSIASIATRRRMSLLHTHHVGPYVYGAAAGALCGRPVVHTEHSHEFYDSARRRFIGRVMGTAGPLVAVSDEIASFHQRAFGNRCQVIANGVPLDERCAPPSPTRGRLRLGYVGRLASEKRVDVFLSALALLLGDGHDVEALVAGDGPLRASLERHADEIGVARQVRFLGRLEDVGRVYRAVDVVVLASEREGLPLAVLEGLAAGRPFASTPVGELPWLAAAGVGRCADDLSPASLARVLADLARHSDEIVRMGRQGRDLVEREYGVSRMCERYLNVYRSLGVTHSVPREAA